LTTGSNGNVIGGTVMNDSRSRGNEINIQNNFTGKNKQVFNKTSPRHQKAPSSKHNSSHSLIKEEGLSGNQKPHLSDISKKQKVSHIDLTDPVSVQGENVSKKTPYKNPSSYMILKPNQDKTESPKLTSFIINSTSPIPVIGTVSPITAKHMSKK
jgi:hypothetical protein